MFQVYALCEEEQEKEIAFYCILFVILGIVAGVGMLSQVKCKIHFSFKQKFNFNFIDVHF
jgi:hypothetical protein